jgi:hypothetical protein
MTRIIIVKDFQSEAGFLFYEGESFEPVSGPGDDGFGGEGIEVKVHGEYVWIPADAFELEV